MKKSLLFFGILFFCIISTTYAQKTSEFFSKADAFLKKNVKDGLVDYKGIHDHPDALDALVEMAGKLSVSKDKVDEYQAFWINGYNLMVIKGIVDNYPINSPMDIDGFFDKEKRNIGGTQITLNAIENELLRGNFPDEPRFHFVLVCGALSCPPIIDEAYMPATLNRQLEKQTKKALNDPKFIRVAKNNIKFSQIFEWYATDFTKDGQRIVDFINTCRAEKLPDGAKVSYYEYDWTLNEMK
ncbi:Protein of unknown function, DUF547 [Pricia antarctica]|uniref:DUF547 domain-containing protein n=1 Tax=Pricia antarctica TaxID=641691 RepID=A0A1G6VTM3_9FLAO|nr:DUF547 domain-containing protein [Pricia antarctica]SDD56186.1 Protein of unknown function, DUF547 [Pricia antarctica]